MTRIYVIRHAEAEGNYFLRAQGTYNSRLTPFGIAQLGFLGERFSSVSLDAVYASGLARAVSTAHAVADPKGLPVRIDPDFREIHVGVWEDRPWGNLHRENPEMMFRYNEDPLRWQVEDGEPASNVQKRMLAALRRLESSHPGGTVAVVSHAGAIRLMLAAVHGIPSDQIRWSARFCNTGVTLLEVEGGKITPVFEGDSGHLPEEFSGLRKQKWWLEEKSAGNTPPWLRPWDPDEDAELYARLYADAWRFAHGNAAFDPAPYLRRAYRACMEDPNAICVAMSGEEPMGVIELQNSSESDPGAFHIAFLAMEAKHRGKGRSPVLLGEAISRCREMGKDRIRLCVAPGNTYAEAYYRHMGFVPVGTVPGAVGPLDLLEWNVRV